MTGYLKSNLPQNRYIYMRILTVKVISRVSINDLHWKLNSKVLIIYPSETTKPDFQTRKIVVEIGGYLHRMTLKASITKL